MMTPRLNKRGRRHKQAAATDGSVDAAPPPSCASESNGREECHCHSVAQEATPHGDKTRTGAHLILMRGDRRQQILVLVCFRMSVAARPARCVPPCLICDAARQTDHYDGGEHTLPRASLPLPAAFQSKQVPPSQLPNKRDGLEGRRRACFAAGAGPGRALGGAWRIPVSLALDSLGSGHRGGLLVPEASSALPPLEAARFGAASVAVDGGNGTGPSRQATVAGPLKLAWPPLALALPLLARPGPSVFWFLPIAISPIPIPSHLAALSCLPPCLPCPAHPRSRQQNPARLHLRSR